MVAAGYITEFAFGGLGLIPAARHAKVDRDGDHLELHHHPEHHLPAAGRALLVRFVRSGAVPMLKMMGGSPA